MKKILVSISVVFSAIIIPSISNAQQTGTPPVGSLSCSVISGNLAYGTSDASTNSGNSVSTLQNFLNTEGYLTTQPTGFFGHLTMLAVEAFQSANGISPTGYVGPLTRAKIQAMDCNSPAATSTVSTTITTASPTPTTSQSTQTSFCQNEGWICAKAASYGNPNTSSTTPVVTNITGPAVVDVGQQGTWTVSAQDPQNKSLSYSVNWGDASTTCTANYTCLSNSAPVAYFSTISNFTHVYSTPGTYTPVFTVQDSARITTQATTTVLVSSTQASTTASAAPIYSLAGTPTIVKQYVGGSSTAALYTAVFNLVVTTGNEPVTLNLPSSQHQAIIAQVYDYYFTLKNNAIPYTVSYFAPSNSTLSSDGSSFTILANQTVTIPVTINFTNNYGAIASQVAIQQINSSAGSDNSMAQNQSHWQTSSL